MKPILPHLEIPLYDRITSHLGLQSFALFIPETKQLLKGLNDRKEEELMCEDSHIRGHQIHVGDETIHCI